MKAVRITLCTAALAGVALVLPAGLAGATGQPGANGGVTCGNGQATATPGNSTNANGSPFNPSGQAGNVYAGNPGTASLNSNNPTAVSEYDIACLQVATH